ncbi:putative major facilitator superfamily, MFS transporter superfamily [Septoria linicola]|nr:putative major facilitator superfamily, MFS transporter superfamily [Septoria linicola]
MSGKQLSEGEARSASPELSSTAASDLDENYDVYKQHNGEPIDPAKSKAVLRKINLRLIPTLWLLYLLQYLDKNGYLAGQYPAGFLMQELPLGKFLAGTCVTWGVILMTTPACTNFAGIATNRSLLGFVEAAVNPGFVLMMGMWYVSAEQPLRLEAYYCTNGIATMFGGLIGYAIGHINGVLARWMYVFIIFGSCSLAAGVYAFIVLPDLPSKAKFLNPRERYIAVERVARNRQGVKNSKFSRHQAMQTLYDPKTWILFMMAVGVQVPNSALTSFTSLIIKSFGFDTLGTQYLQIPGGAVQFLSLLGGGFICTKFPNVRCITMIVANLICILGSGLLVGLPDSNKWGRLVAIWLCYFQGIGFSMSLTMISSNIGGFTKKQLTGVIIFTDYCIVNIIGPQTFKDNESPGYHSAYIAMLVGYSVKLTAVCVLYFYMWSVNEQRDRAPAASGLSREEEEKAAIENGMHDMTELDNRGFRYVL